MKHILSYVVTSTFVCALMLGTPGAYLHAKETTDDAVQIKQMQALITLLMDLIEKLKEAKGDAGPVEEEDEEDTDESSIERISVVLNTDDEDAVATVFFSNDTEEEYQFDTAFKTHIIRELADELNEEKETIEDRITFEDPSEEIRKISVEFQGGDSEVTVTYGNGTKDDFSLNTTRHPEVIEAIVEEIDRTEDAVRDAIVFEDGELTIEVTIDDGEADIDITYEDASRQRITFRGTDEETIIAKIVERTGLTEEEVEDVIEIEERE